MDPAHRPCAEVGGSGCRSPVERKSAAASWTRSKTTSISYWRLMPMLLLSLALGADVIVVGDSWGTGAGATEFSAMAKVRNLSVDNIAIGGSTIEAWQTDSYLLRLFEALTASPDARFIWLTLGGNDYLNGLGAGKSEGELIPQMQRGLERILDELFKYNKHVQVVGFGYDIPNYDSSLGCLGTASRLAASQCRDVWGGVPDHGFKPFVKCAPLPPPAATPPSDVARSCSNTMTVAMQHGLLDPMEQRYAQFTALSLLGTTQMYGGVAGAAVGAPNMQSFSPTQFWEADCIHPNAVGYRAIFAELGRKYFDKRMGGA